MIQTLAEADDAGFKGKVAIVTEGGVAGDGIVNGRTACLLLVAAGAQVFVVDHDIPSIETLQPRAEAGNSVDFSLSGDSRQICVHKLFRQSP